MPPHATVVGVPGRIVRINGEKVCEPDLDQDKTDPYQNYQKEICNLRARMCELEKKLEELKTPVPSEKSPEPSKESPQSRREN